MKTFKQFLKLNEGVAIARSFIGKGLTQDQFDKLKKIDPTLNSKYVDWLAVQYVKNKTDVFTNGQLTDKLKEFDQKSTKGILKDESGVAVKDINKLKSINQLDAILTNNKESTSKRETMNQVVGVTNSKVAGLTLGKDYDILKDTPKYIAYGVYNHKASVIIGKDTGWCTTMTEPTHWDAYTKNGNHFIYIVDKKNLSQVEVRKPKNPNDKLLYKGNENPVRWSNFDDKFLDPSNDTWAVYKDANDELKYVDKGDNTTNKAPTKFRDNIGLTEDDIIDLFKKHKEIIAIKPKKDLKKIIKASPVNADLNHLDISNVTDMSELFSGTKFNGDISKWDVSHVTNMSYMFDRAKFNGDISKWDVSNVTNMSNMFVDSRFNGDISKWDVSNVTNMSDMFFFSDFNGDISKWDVSNVTDMSSMFSYSPLESKYGENGENFIKK